MRTPQKTVDKLYNQARRAMGVSTRREASLRIYELNLAITAAARAANLDAGGFTVSPYRNSQFCVYFMTGRHPQPVLLHEFPLSIEDLAGDSEQLVARVISFAEDCESRS